MVTKVLFVCLGNICRSPTAHGVLAQKVAQRGLSKRIQVDSAGTSDWHIGSLPDKRTRQVALQRGYDLSDQRGRQVIREDFAVFDYILAMDKQNLNHLQRLAPAGFSGHLGLFLDFLPQQPLREIPDPYHGGPEGFIQVLDLVEAGCDALIEKLLATA